MELSGGFTDYFIAFASGVLVSFTPCVYPVLPLTASFVAGINTKGSRLMGFYISLIYVLGLALTYCGLAVFAALSGKVFGQIQNSPVVFLIVAVVLGFFALVLFDRIPLPNFGVSVHNKIKTKNIWTVILFGMASGLVIGPCTAPVLGTVLLYIASKQNVANGIVLMFLFSYGVGASLILVGTFSGILSTLPKSGKWLVWVKRFCGVVLLLAAVYFFAKAAGIIY